MEKTYLFYDLETTGQSKCFDQVLQFAAIRTDLQLNEIERYSFQIKLNPDIIPNPEALLVHRIPVAAMLQGEAEIDAISRIHAILNTPGTQSGGYNTISFDDEFLRFLFHRNLLPPYTHQWANECGRFDLYPLAQLYHLYHPTCLQWPTNSDGKISLKLEHLSNANQLAKGPAHQAITDVEATLALARIFMQNKEMWSYAMDFFNKEREQKRRAKITSVLETTYGKYQLALLIGKTGSSDFFQYPVLALGGHQHYKNQTLWLRLDKPELATTTRDTLTETTWVARQKAGETFLLPFSGRFKQHITTERATVIESNLNWLSQNNALLLEIQRYHQHYKYPEVPNVDVDADLYVGGFLSRDEEQQCVQFHLAPEQKKSEVAARFKNPRLKEIATRLMGRYYPQYLTAELKEGYAAYMQHINPLDEEDALVDWRGDKKLTPKAALQRIAEIRGEKQLDEEGIKLLEDLERYIVQAFIHLPLVKG